MLIWYIGIREGKKKSDRGGEGSKEERREIKEKLDYTENNSKKSLLSHLNSLSEIHYRKKLFVEINKSWIGEGKGMVIF